MSLSVLGWLLLSSVVLLALGACRPSQYKSSTPAEEGTPFPSGEFSFAAPGVTIASGTPPGFVTELATEPVRPAPTAQPTEVVLPPTPRSSPAPPPKPLPGIEISGPPSPNSVPLIAQSGSHWTKRNGLLWSVVATSEGLYNWGNVASLEAQLREASAAGLETILVVRGTPIWAQEIPGFHCGPIAPDQLSAFGDFLYEAVRRYSAPPFNIRYWEIWNEPDASWQRVAGASQYGCWGDSSAPYFGGAYFGEMLQEVYPRMKEADPDAQVLFGGLLLDCDPLNPPDDPAQPGTPKDCISSTFLEGVLQNGGGDYFDGVSFHAYDLYYGDFGDYRNPNWHSSWDSTGPVLIPKARYLRNLLDAYGYEDKYLLNTEGALLCGSSGQEPLCQNKDYSDSKAIYLAQSMAAAQAEGLLANIWYSLSGWRGSHLVSNNSGIPNDSYRAFETSALFLENAAYLGPVSGYIGVTGYRFLQENQERWLIWSLDGAAHTVSLPKAPADILNIFGEDQPIGQEIEITLSPVWLTFPK